MLSIPDKGVIFIRIKGIIYISVVLCGTIQVFFFWQKRPGYRSSYISSAAVCFPSMCKLRQGLLTQAKRTLAKYYDKQAYWSENDVQHSRIS